MSHFCEGAGMKLVLKPMPYDITVCKLTDLCHVNTKSDFFFLSRTDEEISLVCRTEETPNATVAREDGWKAFRIEGVLDFSLVGILSKISGILADEGIGIFAVSTYNTDYVLVKKENFERALAALEERL